MRTTKLENLNACRDAIIFSKQFKTPKEAWMNCQRGDWMLWIAAKLKIDKRLLTLAKGKCAETVLYLMKDQRSKDAVKAAIDYGNGLIDDKQLAAYYTAAYDAAAAAAATAIAADADAAAAAAAYYAADAAYYAAYSADAAADAAYYAAYYADADYAADAAADANSAKKENQLATANICRDILTKEVLKAYNKLRQ